MKLRYLKQAVLALLATLAFFITARPAGAQTAIGSGADSSFIVIQAPDFGTLYYQVYYNYSASLNLDTYFLLTQITTAVPALSINYTNYGSAEAPNYFINSITYNGTTLSNSNTPPDFSPSWFQSVSGGQSGYPTASPIASGAWQDGSGISAPYRLIAPGSWDGLVFGEYGDQPTVLPVPEPTQWMLFGAGGVFLLLTQRRRTRA
jgi:hypothetical protein